jgi:hypothetical protein
VQLSAAITDLFENPLADAAGNPLTTPLTFTFASGTFGITRPTHGTGVLERTTLTLEASATAGLNIATVVFTVNGQVLPAVAGPPYTTTYNVGAAAATPTLTITASGRNAGGTEVAADTIVVPVAEALRASPRLLGVPLGGTAPVRLILPSPLTTDLTVQLAAGDPAIATPAAATAVIPAGQTEITVVVSGLQVGATTITATSTRGVAWTVAAVSQPVSKSVIVHALPALAAVTPSRSIGRVIAAPNGAQTLVLPLLPSPAGLDTPVTITSSNPAVASVAGSVVIPQGGQAATFALTTGAPGTATLTIQAGGVSSQVTVVVGPPFPADLVVPASARPVGLNVLPSPTLGRVVTPPATQASLTVLLLSTPAASATVVTVTSTNPSIAQVVGAVTVPAGSQSATIALQTGAAGTATLTFTVDGQGRDLTVFVGTPPPGTLAPILARPVGITVLPPLSAGRIITPTAGQTTVTVQLLSTPAAAATPVTVTSSNPAVATIEGPLTIPPGTVGVAITLQFGEPGSATLTFAVGSEVRELSVIVGTPPAGLLPLVAARPVGLYVLPPRDGRVFGAVGGQMSIEVELLVAPAGNATPVTVTTSDASVASVPGNVVIAPGATGTMVDIVTGNRGVATLQVTAGGRTRTIEVVVGTPPPGLVPTVVAPVVGVRVQ